MSIGLTMSLLTLALLRWLPSTLPMKSAQVLYPYLQDFVSQLPYDSSPLCSPCPRLLSIACSGSFPFWESLCECCHELSPGSLHSWCLLVLWDSAQSSLPQKVSADGLPRSSLPTPQLLFTRSPQLMSFVAFITAFSCLFHALFIVCYPQESEKYVKAGTISLLFTVVSPLSRTKEVLNGYWEMSKWAHFTNKAERPGISWLLSLCPLFLPSSPPLPKPQGLGLPALGSSEKSFFCLHSVSAPLVHLGPRKRVPV